MLSHYFGDYGGDPELIAEYVDELERITRDFFEDAKDYIDKTEDEAEDFTSYGWRKDGGVPGLSGLYDGSAAAPGHGGGPAR